MHLCGAQRVETDDSERAFLAEDRHLEFNCRVGRFDLRQAGDARVQRFVEARSRAAYHEVGFARKMMRGKIEFVERA